MAKGQPWSDKVKRAISDGQIYGGKPANRCKMCGKLCTSPKATHCSNLCRQQDPETRTTKWKMNEERSQATYGISLIQYLEFRGQKPNPITVFNTQRKNANRREILWELSFLQWWQLWLDSGKWRLRGRGRNLYVMSRRNDKGSYCADNVFIQTGSDNVTEAMYGNTHLHDWWNK